MYVGDRPLLVALQSASEARDATEQRLRRTNTPWWRKPTAWRERWSADAHLQKAWDMLGEADWDAIAVEEIRTAASLYWMQNDMDSNPFHPRALGHLDAVLDAVRQRVADHDLNVHDIRVLQRLEPQQARALYLAEVDRLQQVAADPQMLTLQRPTTRRRAADHPGLRELVVQHKASGLRAIFYYGGRDHAQVGWVLSKTYSVDSIDPDRTESGTSRGASWRAYAGLGIGTKIYQHASTVLPELRWADGSVSPYGKGIRRRMHTQDPWRWQLNTCTCAPDWPHLTSAQNLPCST